MTWKTPQKAAEYAKKWRQRHPGHHKKYAQRNAILNRQRARDERLRLIKEFGGTCTSCGETDPIVLTFDHVQNDGANHRRTVRGKNIIDLVKSAPEKYQLLCQNCNWRKEYWRRYNAIGKREAASVHGNGRA
jgi:hypothetical protein